MEEVHLLQADHILSVLHTLEQNCKLLLPGGSVLEPVTLHIYQKKHHQSATDNRLFLIRWGVHQIYQFKTLPRLEAAETLEHIQRIIANKAKPIRKALIEYCPEILNDALTLKLEPELSKRAGMFSAYKIRVCPSRLKSEASDNGGWPNFCVFLSWTDEQDNFQEFNHRLHFNSQKRCFEIPVKEIVDRFLIFRDTIV